MKDKIMLEFYKSQSGFDKTSFSKWCTYCADVCERHGSYAEFIGRLKRCHLAQQRSKVARHGSDPTMRVGP